MKGLRITIEGGLGSGKMHVAQQLVESDILPAGHRYWIVDATEGQTIPNVYTAEDHLIIVKQISETFTVDQLWDRLEITQRMYNVFTDNKIIDLDHIFRLYSTGELDELPNLGIKSLKEIQFMLERFGYVVKRRRRG